MLDCWPGFWSSISRESGTVSRESLEAWRAMIFARGGYHSGDSAK